MMGDTSVRRPMIRNFEKGVDFGFIIHKSPLVVNHLLEHHFLSQVELESLLFVLRGCLSQRRPPFSIQYLCLCHGYLRCIPWHIPRISAALFMATMGAATTATITPISCTMCHSSQRLQMVPSNTAKTGVWGAAKEGWARNASGRYSWYKPRDTMRISVALGTNIISVAFRAEDIRRYPRYMTSGN